MQGLSLYSRRKLAVEENLSMKRGSTHSTSFTAFILVYWPHMLLHAIALGICGFRAELYGLGSTSHFLASFYASSQPSGAVYEKLLLSEQSILICFAYQG